MTTPIHASALRIGMFVHLNVGWMSHPFPLSSFRIVSAEQVATIRSLGLQRVRWSPLQSDLPGVPEATWTINSVPGCPSVPVPVML